MGFLPDFSWILRRQWSRPKENCTHFGAGKPELPESEDLHSHKIHINHKSVYSVIVVARGSLFVWLRVEEKK
jgi:hypothetical protein